MTRNKQNETTNSFYADEMPKVKDYFKLIKKEIDLNEPNFRSLLDVGCATGDFLRYIEKSYGFGKEYYGVDNFCELLNIAESRVNNAKFIQGDIFTGINDIKADVVCMSGVLYLFEDFKKVFENLLLLTNDRGSIYIFSIYNTNGVRVQHKFWHNNIEGNIVEFSTKEIEDWLDNKNLEFEFIPFELSTEISKSDDPLRSYTIELRNGKYGVVNGLNIWHNFFLLRIKK